MIVDLNELRLKNEPLDVAAEFSGAELHVDNQWVHLQGRMHSRMIVSLHGDCARVRGHLEGAVSMACCRCTRGIEKPLEKDFRVEYWPDPEVERDGEELGLSYEDLDVGFYRNDELDLSAVISEQIVLEIPMKPVCREDCRGLCDQCGADLNEIDCGCSREKIDPRLSVLVDFKKHLN